MICGRWRAAAPGRRNAGSAVAAAVLPATGGLRPTLVEVLATTPGVAPYFDLSFQHASGAVLRRMRRFGSDETFLELLGRIRALRPDAGVRSNFIVGFPGETEEDVRILVDFLAAARWTQSGSSAIATKTVLRRWRCRGTSRSRRLLTDWRLCVTSRMR